MNRHRSTLVDVYGKLGDWEKALQVVTAMQREGVTPVLRTWNTLLIACNMCNQPREALGVFVTMQVRVFSLSPLLSYACTPT